jgi:anti-anti-sigma factor
MPAVRTVVLSGEIDVENTPRIRRRIGASLRVSRATGCAVVVDCTAVIFVESRGLAMMARLQRRADEEGLPLSWRGFNEHVLKTIHVTGLDAYLRIDV